MGRIRGSTQGLARRQLGAVPPIQTTAALSHGMQPLLKAAAALALSCAAYGQDVGTIVLRIGDPVPNHGNITTIHNMDVNRAGRWAYVVDTDFPISMDLALVTSEGFTLGESHEVPRYPNSVIKQMMQINHPDWSDGTELQILHSMWINKRRRRPDCCQHQ